MLTAVTSRRNDCLFLTGSHAAVAAELLGDRELLDAVFKDFESAPFDARCRSSFQFLAKICRQSFAVTQENIDRAKAAGWSDEALHADVTVCALIQIYNTWIDETGVQDTSASAYKMMGKRLAERGYAFRNLSTTTK